MFSHAIGLWTSLSKDQFWTSCNHSKTVLDWFKWVWLLVARFWNISKSVCGLVASKKAKKLDQTGLLNTNGVYNNHNSAIMSIEDDLQAPDDAKATNVPQDLCYWPANTRPFQIPPMLGICNLYSILRVFCFDQLCQALTSIFLKMMGQYLLLSRGTKSYLVIE